MTMAHKSLCCIFARFSGLFNIEMTIIKDPMRLIKEVVLGSISNRMLRTVLWRDPIFPEFPSVDRIDSIENLSRQ